jgi:hypothetical protein
MQLQAQSREDLAQPLRRLDPLRLAAATPHDIVRVPHEDAAVSMVALPLTIGPSCSDEHSNAYAVRHHFAVSI